MKRNEQIDIRRDLAVAGAFSFLCCCARACLIPFLTLYFRQLGLTPAMTGVVMGTKHLVALAWSPVALLLAKHYDKRRAVINASLVCSAAAALALLLVPLQAVHPQGAGCNRSDPSGGPTQSLGGAPSMASSARPQTTNVMTPPSHSGVNSTTKTLPGTKSSPHRHNHSHAPLLPLNATVVVEGGAGEPTAAVHHPAPSAGAPVRSKRSEEEAEQEEAEQEERRFTFLGSLKALDPQHQLFFLILVIVVAWELAAAPLEGTADDGLYEYLDSADASDRHGGPAAWGLLGAACGVGGAGLLVSRLSCVVAGGLPRSAAHFFCYAAVAAAALPAAARLPLQRSGRRERAGGLLKAARLLLGSPRALLCAATALLVGAASSAVDDFLLWQMQDHGSGELHMGLSLAAALLARAAFPPLAPRLSGLLGPGRVLPAAAACLAAQCLYYSFLWGPWAAAPALALSGFSGGALWWAVGRQCEDVATPGAERSVRRLYGALALQLGGGLGSLAGGLAAQRVGLAWLFRGAALAVAAWCACLPLLQFKAPRQRRINYSRLLAADASEDSDTESEQERDWLEEAMDDGRNNNNNGRRVNH